ncbi:hypothetical protein TNCV_2365571 [Trichonephila clavipes]|nr:hypothetical protein TNCV_2365571 [Trichonephila clavipes]
MKKDSGWLRVLLHPAASTSASFIHQYDPENKRLPMEYRHPGSSSVNKIKTFMSSTKPRFSTVGLSVVPKIEGDVEKSTFFNGCRSSGSRTQIDLQPTRMVLHGRNEEMNRTIGQMCNC